MSRSSYLGGGGTLLTVDGGAAMSTLGGGAVTP